MDPEIDFAGIMSQFDTFLTGRDVRRHEGDGECGEVVERHHRSVKELKTKPGKDIAIFGGSLEPKSGLASARTRDAEVAIASRLHEDRNHGSEIRHRES
jgi:hypothetical protein